MIKTILHGYQRNLNYFDFVLITSIKPAKEIKEGLELVVVIVKKEELEHIKL
jgi:hypothetical protein